MPKSDANPEDKLSRRERQIMDIVYARNPITAREIQKAIPDAPSYSSVRKILYLLIEKGELRGKRSGRALLYTPVRSRATAAKSAVRRLVDTFYGGSVEAAVVGLLDLGEEKLSAEEAAELRRRIAESKTDQTGKSENE